MKPRFVYVTCGNKTEAEEIAKVLLTEKLIACANIIEGMDSLYWWKGKIESSQETILIMKTLKGKMPELEKKVFALHSYDVPCMVSLPIREGNTDYLAWIAESVGNLMNNFNKVLPCRKLWSNN